MQPHRDRRPSTRRTVRTLHCTLVAALILGAAVAAPRRAEAQLPAAAQVVAAVAQWMARWLGDYLLGRGVNVALERARGAVYRDQLENLEQVLRSQIRRGVSNRSQLARELKFVERQRRLVNGVLNPAFTRDSARVYYGRVNEDMDELREVVRAVTVSMDTAWATIDDMQRELDALRREVKGLRRNRPRANIDDEGDERQEESRGPSGIPAGVRLGLGYIGAQSRFTIPAYSATAASPLSRRQQGATVHAGIGDRLRLGVTASLLGAWLDSSSRSDRSAVPATKQPLQTVTLGADLALAMGSGRFLRPLIGGAVEQVWHSFRSLPEAQQADVVFSGLVYGPQAGFDLRLLSGFSVAVLARSMNGQLLVPTDQLEGLRGTRAMTKIRRNQIVAILSYTEK